MDISNERYNRNILAIEKSGQEKLFSSSVAVCGAGGLGSTVLLNLAALGVGKITVIDFDTVEASNLNRQYIHTPFDIGCPKVESAKEKLNCFNPDVEITTHKTKLNNDNWGEIIKDCDIIVDCADSYESKFLLNDIALLSEKPLVSAGVSGFKGQITTIMPKKTPCLRCIFDSTPEVPIEKGVVSPAVSTIASLESMEVLKLVLGKGEPFFDKMLFFDGLKGSFKTLNIKIRKNCTCQKNIFTGF